MNINFSTATRGKLHVPHMVPRWELIPCLWLKRCASFPQAPQEEFSLNRRKVRGTLHFLSQVEWTPRGPDSKDGTISLQWIKFRLVFHLTRWRHVWIHWGDPWGSHRFLPHLDMGPLIPLNPREEHGIQCFIRWRCLTLLFFFFYFLVIYLFSYLIIFLLLLLFFFEFTCLTLLENG